MLVDSIGAQHWPEPMGSMQIGQEVETARSSRAFFVYGPRCQASSLTFKVDSDKNCTLASGLALSAMLSALSTATICTVSELLVVAIQRLMASNSSVLWSA